MATIKDYISQHGFNTSQVAMDDKVLSVTVLVSFMDGNKEDSAEFEIGAENVEELNELYNVFCKETGIPADTVFAVSVTKTYKNIGSTKGPVRKEQPFVVSVNEIINWVYSDYKDTLVATHTLKGNTLSRCFEKVYALRRSARYDSARRYDFVDSSLEEKFQAWKNANETIEMYYGSGVVD